MARASADAEIAFRFRIIHDLGESDRVGRVEADDADFDFFLGGGSFFRLRKERGGSNQGDGEQAGSHDSDSVEGGIIRKLLRGRLRVLP